MHESNPRWHGVQVLLLLTTWKRGTTTILGRTRVEGLPGSNLVHRAVLALYRTLSNNSVSSTRAWGINPKKTLEISLTLQA